MYKLMLLIAVIGSLLVSSPLFANYDVNVYECDTGEAVYEATITLNVDGSFVDSHGNDGRWSKNNRLISIYYDYRDYAFVLVGNKIKGVVIFWADPRYDFLFCYTMKKHHHAER